jgi:hypothetical protein
MYLDLNQNPVRNKDVSPCGEYIFANTGHDRVKLMDGRIVSPGQRSWPMRAMYPESRFPLLLWMAAAAIIFSLVRFLI